VSKVREECLREKQDELKAASRRWEEQKADDIAQLQRLADERLAAELRMLRDTLGVQFEASRVAAARQAEEEHREATRRALKSLQQDMLHDLITEVVERVTKEMLATLVHSNECHYDEVMSIQLCRFAHTDPDTAAPFRIFVPAPSMRLAISSQMA